ncbi:MAG TPA: LapA family protein [Burkholderiales bacterium]|jgi:lipopolysaccharide assembly protein A|nr:LapA family protein [Burkholderiales bacterium]
MALLRFLSLLAWTLIFILLLLFAIKNAEFVDLHFYFDQHWQAPLIVVVLAAFAGGTLFGFLACLPPLIRQRREIMGLRKEIRIRDKAGIGAPPRDLGPTPSETPPLV